MADRAHRSRAQAMVVLPGRRPQRRDRHEAERQNLGDLQRALVGGLRLVKPAPFDSVMLRYAIVPMRSTLLPSPKHAASATGPQISCRSNSRILVAIQGSGKMQRFWFPGQPGKVMDA